VHPAPVEATDDPGRAARRLMTDDGFNVGVLYKGKRAPYTRGNGAAQSVEDLACQFRI
jgi:2-oxoglutarate ferredoxin oxidoreductase subunit beta